MLESLKYLLRSSRQHFFAAHRVQVSSFGGSGTTMVGEFLQDQGLALPRSRDWDPWKHMRVPPRDMIVRRGFRAVYLFGDPLGAILSIFRRGLQSHHMRRIGGDFSRWNWNWGLEEYLRNGADLFGFDEHLTNWLTARRRYPILLLKYETLWESLPEMFDFVGLPRERIGRFPAKRPRASRLENENADVRRMLAALYGGLRERIEALPDVILRAPEAPQDGSRDSGTPASAKPRHRQSS